MSLPDDILADLDSHLGLSVTGAHPLGGGCIHHAHRIETQQGRLFLKYNHLREADNFDAESRGLKLLQEAEMLRVPEVKRLGQTKTHAYLLLEFIEEGRRSSQFWHHLGLGLARLHQQTASVFGLNHDNYIGALTQSNHQHASWTDFFVQERLQPMLRMAVNRGRMPKEMRADFQRLFTQLHTFFPDEPPALIHGDLWGGNLLCDAQGAPVLIDPAVYYGHREIELAFMTLFDSQPSAFYEAYESVWPLETGWRDRFDLYNLYPLLVHVNLFGGGYLNSVRHILRQYV